MIKSESTRDKKGEETGSYIQMFVYRVPKKNHGAMADAQTKLATIFKKHGILRSEFFQLSSTTKTFKGFTSIYEMMMSANHDNNRKDDGEDEQDEIWLELEHYKDEKEKDEVIARIGQDPNAGPLFGQVMGLVTEGSSSIQGDFRRLRLG